jgi:hypothetical protein
VRAASPATVESIAKIVQSCLRQGTVVEIDRLGVFRPTGKDSYRFIPSTAPSVFIAYAQEDLPAAARLYRELKRAGMNPWMDRRKLLPGQNWPRAIERAIEMSDFFVACLSRRSIVKRGTFQSELRYALDCARRLPLEDVYFLPVRLEECEVPARIRQSVHYVDLFPNFAKGTKHLLSLIRKESARRRASSSR